MVYDTDIYLFKKIKEDNDQKAFEIIFKKHYKPVYSYLRYYINEEYVCHDLAQDIFAYLWEKRHKIEIKQTLIKYLLSAAHNASINHLKKQSNHKRHISDFFNINPSEHDGYATIYENELLLNLNNIITELPPQCREIFHLSRMKGMKHKEIAKKLNISTRTVETQIYRALRIIKIKLSYKN
ncbi:MAG: RNA polymerase sigma-70 factor [Chlorobi bacterium]|nr:RNA polymerase sigma-70 factor [Chlorobiota bacterium]